MVICQVLYQGIGVLDWREMQDTLTSVSTSVSMCFGVQKAEQRVVGPRKLASKKKAQRVLSDKSAGVAFSENVEIERTCFGSVYGPCYTSSAHLQRDACGGACVCQKCRASRGMQSWNFCSVEVCSAS